MFYCLFIVVDAQSMVMSDGYSTKIISKYKSYRIPATDIFGSSVKPWMKATNASPI
jgi:hypothetical protein